MPTPTLPPRLSLTTPINAPVPTPTTPGLSALVCLQNLTLRQFKGCAREWLGWGRALGGLSRPLTQPSPPPPQERLPPSDMRADGQRNPWGGGGYGGVNGQLWLSSPGVVALDLLPKPLPPDPPPTPPSSCTLLPDIPVKGHPEARCRMTEGGRGSGCPALRWAGIGAGFRPPPPASGGVRGPTNPA